MSKTAPGHQDNDRRTRRDRPARPAPAPGPEDERLPLGRTTAYGFQYVLTMYGAIVAVPLVIGQAAGVSGEETALLISSCLLMGGIATILQSFGAPCLGSRLPLVQGVSFAGVAPMLAILAGGSDLTVHPDGLRRRRRSRRGDGDPQPLRGLGGGGDHGGAGHVPRRREVVAAVPTPVLGGASIVLFGTVASSGVRTLATVDFSNSMNLVIVAVAFAVGLVPVAAPAFYAGFPSWAQTVLGSGISAAAIVAIALNLLFNELSAGNSEHQSVVAAAPVRVVRADMLAHLREGDRIQNGAVLDRDGTEVAVVAEHHVDDVRKMIDDGEITHTGQIRTVLAAKDATA